MTFIFWSGKGYFVIIFAFGFSLVANLVSNSITGSGVYWDAHKWPLAVSLFTSAAACWFAGRFYQKEKPRVLIDPKTRKEFILKRRDTFFFIPIVWWGPILAVCGLIALGAEFMR